MSMVLALCPSGPTRTLPSDEGRETMTARFGRNRLRLARPILAERNAIVPLSSRERGEGAGGAFIVRSAAR
jgi:hypothetical protein